MKNKTFKDVKVGDNLYEVDKYSEDIIIHPILKIAEDKANPRWVKMFISLKNFPEGFIRLDSIFWENGKYFSDKKEAYKKLVEILKSGAAEYGKEINELFAKKIELNDKIKVIEDFIAKL